MKKILFMLAAGAFLVSCNSKEEQTAREPFSENIELAAYSVSSFKNEEVCTALETKMRKMDGIRAVKANYMSQRVAIMFNNTKTDINALETIMEESASVELTQDPFNAEKPSMCPVDHKGQKKTVSAAAKAAGCPI